MSYRIGRNHKRNLSQGEEQRDYPTLNVIVPYSKKPRKIKIIARLRKSMALTYLAHKPREIERRAK